jgi:hypothetical protein
MAACANTGPAKAAERTAATPITLKLIMEYLHTDDASQKCDGLVTQRLGFEPGYSRTPAILRWPLMLQGTVEPRSQTLRPPASRLSCDVTRQADAVRVAHQQQDFASWLAMRGASVSLQITFMRPRDEIVDSSALCRRAFNPATTRPVIVTRRQQDFVFLVARESTQTSVGCSDKTAGLM